VGVTVAVFVMVAVNEGVAVAGLGVSLAGRKGVRVGLSSGDVPAAGTLIMGAQPASTNPIKNMPTANRLFLIAYARLQLHLPDRLQQRTALLEARFAQVTNPKKNASPAAPQ
jgi:hypothetical protein